MDNGGFTLTVNNKSNLIFSAGGSLSGSGGLVKNGTGTLTPKAPMNFTGPITLTSGSFSVSTTGEPLAGSVTAVNVSIYG